MDSQDPGARIRELERQVEMLRNNNARDQEHIVYLERNRMIPGSSYGYMDDLELYRRANAFPGGYDDDYDDEDEDDADYEEWEFQEMDDDDEGVPKEYEESFRPDIDQDGPDYFPYPQPAAVQSLQAELDAVRTRAEADHARYEEALAELARLREQHGQGGQTQGTQAGMDDAESGPNRVSGTVLDRHSPSAMDLEVNSTSVAPSTPNASMNAAPHSSNAHTGNPCPAGPRRRRGIQQRRRRPNRPIELPMLGNHRVFRYPSEQYIQSRKRCEIEGNGGHCFNESCKDWHDEPLPRKDCDESMGGA